MGQLGHESFLQSCKSFITRSNPAYAGLSVIGLYLFCPEAAFPAGNAQACPALLSMRSMHVSSGEPLDIPGIPASDKHRNTCTLSLLSVQKGTQRQCSEKYMTSTGPSGRLRSSVMRLQDWRPERICCCSTPAQSRAGFL